MTFQLANLRGQSVPPITEKKVKAGQEFLKGALLKLTAGEYEECGADPAVVNAVAESDFGPNTLGWSRLPTFGFPPGYMQAVETQPNIRFSAEYVGDIDAAVEGVNYGVVLSADNYWRVDLTDTGNDVVRLISKSWHDMLSYGFVDESVAESVTLGRNRVIVEFVTPQV